jgi:hypothetical protein
VVNNQNNDLIDVSVPRSTFFVKLIETMLSIDFGYRSSIASPSCEGKPGRRAGAIREVWTKRQPHASREAIVRRKLIDFFGVEAIARRVGGPPPTRSTGSTMDEARQFTVDLNAWAEFSPPD